MSELEQLEKRIEGLPPEQFVKFREWFIEFDHLAWDKQIEADAKAGKLDKLMEEAKQDYLAGRCKPLP